MSTSSTLSLTATISVIAVCLSACSSGPRLANMEKHLRSRVEEESKGHLTLVGFKKTNGQEGELFGVPVYSLDYEAEIEVLEPCFWARNSFGETTFRTVTPQEMNVFLEVQGFRRAPQGERVTLSGSFQFEKTERGWKGPGGKIF